MGARLRVFDLDPAQRGQTEALLLNREGNCALLPLNDRIARVDGQLWLRSHDTATIERAVAQLSRDGWTVFGRVAITFTGQDASTPSLSHHLD
jgi:hypothetical protein